MVNVIIASIDQYSRLLCKNLAKWFGGGNERNGEMTAVKVQVKFENVALTNNYMKLAFVSVC
jgi:hypothetical protein